MRQTLLLLGLIVFLARAEIAVEVITLSGNVQIKKEESRKWETLQKGDEINDNDILQTAYKSTCEIRIGRDNILFMGSNSRILVSKITGKDRKDNISITLFSGSVYSKIIKQVDYAIYTSTSLCKVSSGIFNCTVDEISGITGYHVFKGDIVVSNIAVQGEQPLKAGETSTIAPNTPPSSPRKISAKQMSVLTRFYGADFINQEIEETGLEVTSAGGPSSGAEAAAPVQTGQSKPGPVAPLMPAAPIQKTPPKTLRLFDKAYALKKLQEYDEEHYWMYREPAPKPVLDGSRFRGAVVFSNSSLGGRSYQDYFLRPGLFLKYGSVVLNIPVVADSSGRGGFPMSGTRALLDKIYSADVRYEKSFAHVGEMERVTFGRGLVVRDYTNRAFSDNVRNVGLRARYHTYLTNVDFFTSSLADFHLTGLQYQSIDTTGSFSISLVREGGQKPNRNGGDLAYRAGTGDAPEGLSPDSIAPVVSLTGFEFQLSHNLFYTSPVQIELYGAFAGLFMQDKWTNLRGYSFALPGLNVIWGKQGGLLELFFNLNRFTRGMFGPFYEDNLFLYQRDSSGTITGGLTQAALLPKEPLSMGLRLGYKVNPLKALTVSAEVEGLFTHFGRDYSDTTKPDGEVVLTDGRNNGNLSLRLQLGEGLIKFFNRLDAYYSISHIGYFSRSVYDLFKPNTYTTAGVKGHLLILKNLEAYAGYEYYFYDLNGDSRAVSRERVSSFSVGLGMGF